jgi:hypothetical protein
MNAVPVLTSTIDVDPLEWLVVPGTQHLTPAWRADVLALFQAVADIDRNAEGPDRLFAGGLPIDPEHAVDTLLAFRASLDEDERLVAALTVPNRWPLPVVVSVGVADESGPDLLTLAGATGGSPSDPPAVDELPEDVGGGGPVVTRFDVDDEGVIWATVCAVRRQDGVDTRVLWRTRDLDVVPVFAPEVVALVGRVVHEVSA